MELNLNNKNMKKNDSLMIRYIKQDILKLKNENLDSFPRTIERLKAVLKKNEENISYSEAGKDLGCSRTSVKKWEDIYKKNRLEGLKKLENKPFAHSLRDASKDKQLIESLEVEINRLISKKKHPNTLHRLKAILKYLKSESNRTNNRFGKERVATREWLLKYSKGGIKAIERMENLPINKSKRDSSEDKNLVDKLVREIRNLNSSEYPNTKVRAEAVLKYFTKECTLKEVGSLLGIDSTSIGQWIIKYSKGGIKALKIMENTPLNRTIRDRSQDQELAVNLAKEIKDLDSAQYPNTIKRANAVLSYFESGNSLESIAHVSKVDSTSICNWVAKYSKGGIKVLKDMENLSITKRNRLNDEKLADKLVEEIEGLSPKQFPEILNKANGLISYYRGKIQQADLAAKLGENKMTIQKWIKSYEEGGFYKLLSLDKNELEKYKALQILDLKVIPRKKEQRLKRKPDSYPTSGQRTKKRGKNSL